MSRSMQRSRKLIKNSLSKTVWTGTNVFMQHQKFNAATEMGLPHRWYPLGLLQLPGSWLQYSSRQMMRMIELAADEAPVISVFANLQKPWHACRAGVILAAHFYRLQFGCQVHGSEIEGVSGWCAAEHATNSIPPPFSCSW